MIVFDLDDPSLEWDDDLVSKDGVPITGLGYNIHLGAKEVELHYVDGLPSGMCREFYPNGVLRKEWNARRGHGFYWMRTYAPDGSLIEARQDDSHLRYPDCGFRKIGDERP